MDEQTVKGTGIIPVVRYIQDTHGDEGWQEILKRVSPQTREHLSHPILDIKWYPLPTIYEIYDAAAEAFGKGDPKVCWAIGRAAADYGLNVIYKFFLKLGSPTVFAARGPTMWKSYYRGSELRIAENSKGRMVAVVEGMHTSVAHIHSIAGWMERAAELTGGKNITCTLDAEKAQVTILYT